MNAINLRLIVIFFYLCICMNSTLKGQTLSIMPVKVESDRNSQYSKQLENYLVNYIVDKYEKRSSELWNRDYSSLDSYERSIYPNIERFRKMINPPDLKKSGDLIVKQHPYLQSLGAQWIELPLGEISAEGILVFPPKASKDNPVPLVIAVHGLDGFPETTFGGYVRGYHAYAAKLLEAGYAVLAPMNLWVENRRNHIERLCRLAGTSLLGIEFNRLQNLLDVVLEDERIDRNRVGMWGISLGGLATMFTMPLDHRIKTGVVSAWFNHRRNKMVIVDSRYSSFIATTEEHAFLYGWLKEFSDFDVVSLICPRPLLIQHGKQDKIAWWPQVQEEFDKSKIHYDKLGKSDRIEMYFHEGYHEAITENGLKFLKKWL